MPQNRLMLRARICNITSKHATQTVQTKWPMQCTQKRRKNTKNVQESIYLIPRFHACQNITFKYLPLFFIDDGDARYLIKKVLQREIIKTDWYYHMCYANSFILHYRSIQSISLFAMATYYTFDYNKMGAILFCKCHDVFPYLNLKYI